MSDSKLTVQGVPGRWTAAELKAAELLRLGATEQSVAVELGCHIKQIQSLRKRKHFNDLLDLRTGAAQTYADRWEQIRQRQLDMAGSALDTIEEAIDDRDEQGNVTQTALRAAEGLIKSLEKGVAKESGGGSKELQSFMKRLEDIAVKEAQASAPRVIDIDKAQVSALGGGHAEDV